MREIALMLALALLAPGAAAQTLDGQVEALAEHAEAAASDTIENPQAMAANATNASWQTRQANWTMAWSCDTVSAVDEDAGDRVRNLTGCPESEDAAAGQDPAEEQGEENASVARAEELGNDTATAVDDQVAATEALVNDTLAEPGQAPSHLERFLNRTLTTLERLVGGPWALVEEAMRIAQGVAQEVAQDVGRLVDELLDEIQELGVQLAGVPVDGARWARDAASGIVDTAADGAGRAAGTIASTWSVSATGLEALADDIVDGAERAVQAAEAGLASMVDAIGRVLPGGSPAKAADGFRELEAPRVGEELEPGLELPAVPVVEG